MHNNLTNTQIPKVLAGARWRRSRHVAVQIVTTPTPPPLLLPPSNKQKQTNTQTDPPDPHPPLPKKSKCSNDPYLLYLQGFFALICLTVHNLDYFISSYRIIAQFPAFSQSCDLERRSRSLKLVYIITVEFSHVYHHTKFERNPFITYEPQNLSQSSKYSFQN